MRKNSEEDEFERSVQVYEETQGYKKFLNYLRHGIIETKEFQDRVAKIRKKYQMPPNGFSLDDSEYMFSPRGWKLKNPSGFHAEINRLSERYQLGGFDGSMFFQGYIFYNIDEPYFFPSVMGTTEGPEGFNLCIIRALAADSLTDKGVNTATSREGKASCDADRKSDDRVYPIGLRISPYASLRDIQDFLRKQYKSRIAPLQSWYRNHNKKISIGRFKKRSERVHQRNVFIYQNRHLPRRKILELLEEKYPEQEISDYTYIGKIISEEKKRRKEV